MKFIPLGRVGKPFGLRGELRIWPHNPGTDWFENARRLWLREDPSKEPETREIIKCRRHKKYLVLALEGIRDRDQADSLKGREVVAPEDTLGALEEDEYYWHQLIGLKVVSGDGGLVGEVVRIEETAPELDGNDLLVVLTETGELLVPFIGELVKEVDLEAGAIVISRVSGLMD